MQLFQVITTKSIYYKNLKSYYSPQERKDQEKNVICYFLWYCIGRQEFSPKHLRQRMMIFTTKLFPKFSYSYVSNVTLTASQILRMQMEGKRPPHH